MLSLTTTASELLNNESLTGCCPTPPSLAMSEHSLVQDLPSFIEALRTLSPEVSPVSRFQMPEGDWAQMTPATCGPQLSNAYASYDPVTRSWKMCQGWLLADTSEPSWETWPKAGLIADGEYFPQPNWERRTNEIGSGLLPTPTDVSRGGGSSRSGDRINEIPTLQGMARKGMWPTPRSREAGDYQYSRGNKSKKVLTLTGAVKMWPTPTAVTDTGGARQMMRANGVTEQELNGALNPNWVEWLMGWPIGWTSLEPLSPEAFAAWLDATNAGTWWPNEPDIPRTAKSIASRVDRLKALGNGQVSIVAATAWHILSKQIE